MRGFPSTQQNENCFRAKSFLPLYNAILLKPGKFLSKNTGSRANQPCHACLTEKDYLFTVFTPRLNSVDYSKNLLVRKTDLSTRALTKVACGKFSMLEILPVLSGIPLSGVNPRLYLYTVSSFQEMHTLCLKIP